MEFGDWKIAFEGNRDMFMTFQPFFCSQAERRSVKFLLRMLGVRRY
jgi:hypothetical protein